MPTDSSTLVIHGARPTVQPVETAIPVPTSEIQFDVKLLNTLPSNAQIVKIAIELTNRGSKPLTLNEKDISLRVADNPEVFPTSVEPTLPQELKTGVPVTITLTFPKLQGNSAILRIFDVTLDYYF